MRYTIECDENTDNVWVSASDDAVLHRTQFNVREWRQFRYRSLARTAIDEALKDFPITLPYWIPAAVLQFVRSQQEE